MLINKIICDVCHNEIENFEGYNISTRKPRVSAFCGVNVDTTFSFNKKRYTELDICDNCAKKILGISKDYEYES